MKIRTGIASAALLVIGAIAAIAQPVGSNKVTVTGCPLPGVEAKCLVIRGPDNVTYNITDAKQKPEIGQRAIRLTGTATKKLSYCQQGIVLANITWTYTDQKCTNP